MERITLIVAGGLAAMLVLGLVSCEKANSTPDRPANAEQVQPAAKTVGTSVPGAKIDGGDSPAGTPLALTGIRFDVPSGWVQEAAPASPMGPKAVFKLEPADGDSAECSVRITYFPDMKGKDGLNIDRWLGQVKRADGTPATRDDARIEMLKLGAVQVTVVDVSGAVSTGMGMGGAGADIPNQRMISAIVDHPQGPHFLKAVGGTASMEKWQASIEAFLKSARVE